MSYNWLFESDEALFPPPPASCHESVSCMQSGLGPVFQSAYLPRPVPRKGRGGGEGWWLMQTGAATNKRLVQKE